MTIQQSKYDERQRSQSDMPRLHEFESAVRMEIQSANGQEEMFLRSSSGLSALLKEVGHQHGRPYFRYVLRDVFGEKSTLYQHPSTPDQVLAYAKSILRRLAKAIHFAPLLLRACCQYVLTEFRKAFPASTQDTVIVVGSLLFLRILCPALIKPETFGFRPHTATSRITGVQIAKILQHTLRGTPLSDAHPEHEKANEFIQTLEPFVMTFLNRFPHINSAAVYAATADFDAVSKQTPSRPVTKRTPSWEIEDTAMTSRSVVAMAPSDTPDCTDLPQSSETTNSPTTKVRGLSWSTDENMVAKPKRKFNLKFWSRSH